MSAKRRESLDTPERFLRADIQPGTKLHLHVTDVDGPHKTDEAVFVRLFRACGREIGLIVRLGEQDIDLVWDDVIECWPVQEETDPRYADGRPPLGDRVSP